MRCTAVAKSPSPGVTPLAPDTISRTESFVDMQPSESSRSKVVRVASRSARSALTTSTTASVVRKASIVARPGASIPAPFAIPPTDHPPPTATACLLTLSVVLMASAAAAPPSSLNSDTADPTPDSSASLSLRRPIRPVEQTTTSPAATSSRSAALSAVAWVCWKPVWPV